MMLSTLSCWMLAFAAGSPSQVSYAQTNSAPQGAMPVVGAVAASSSQRTPGMVRVRGTVLNSAGLPAVGAVVLCTSGGQTTTDFEGKFQLELRASKTARQVRLTAVGPTSGQNVASQAVTMSSQPGVVDAGTMQLSQVASCPAAWLPTFGSAPGTSGCVNAMAVFDSGAGPELIVGGDFTSAGGVVARSVARWNGTEWSALGQGTSRVFCMIVFDDGGGKGLFIGSTGGVEKWDGTSWQALGTGMGAGLGGGVHALEVFDDGAGEKLYAGGSFTTPYMTTFNNVARWDGVSWTPLGAGTNDDVLALKVYDDGTGPALYAGGEFFRADGATANGVAKWDGSSWSPLGTGLRISSAMHGDVHALAVFDDGSGPALFAGGNFNRADGLLVSHVARWNGVTWADVGGGSNGPVEMMAVLDVGHGPVLCMGGNFDLVGGIATGSLASWNGAAWASFAGGIPGVRDLIQYDDGTGDAVFAGGCIAPPSNGITASGIAKWDGFQWNPLTTGVNGLIRSLAVFDDGGGNDLYVGGRIRFVGELPVNSIARWDGSSWSALGAGVEDLSDNLGVVALHVHDDGTGSALYAGGDFALAGGTTSRGIAKWDGSSWSPVGGDVLGGVVNAMATFDDGSGPALYLGGSFELVAGVLAEGVAKWDGANWSPVGGEHGRVRAFEVFDDGSGEALYAAGDFIEYVSGQPIKRVARWNGLAWSSVDVSLDFGDEFDTLLVFDDGTGEALHAGGNFYRTPGGIPATGVIRWDGTGWSPLPGRIGRVVTLHAHDDGSGPALFAGGYFTIASGVPAARIARWDGFSWSPVGGGFSDVVLSLESFDDGNGLALFAGGEFSSTIDSQDSGLARWACPENQFNDLCNGDGGNQMGCSDCPCDNEAPPGTVGGCLNSAANSATLMVTGSPSVSLPEFDTRDLRFSLAGAPPLAFCTLVSGAAVAPRNPASSCFGLQSGVQSIQFDGLRCVVEDLRRHGARSTNGSGEVGTASSGSPWGGEGPPSPGIANSGVGTAAGQTRFFQVIHRDNPLAQCMRGFNTSQAICVTFTP